jgi:membrane-bound serine protease (ClpP class)
MQQFIDSLISSFIRSVSQSYASLFLRVDSWAIWLIIIALFGFIAISIIWGIRAHHRPVSAGKEDLVGRTAVADTALEPQGFVIVEGERWWATLDKGYAEPEDEVVITRMKGLKLRVTKKDTAS